MEGEEEGRLAGTDISVPTPELQDPEPARDESTREPVAAEGTRISAQEPAEGREPVTGGAWGEPVGHWEAVDDGAWGQRWVPQGWGAEADAGQPNQELVQDQDQTQRHGTGQGTVEEEWVEPVPVPGPNGRLSAEDEFRLANAFAEAYPQEISRGRAVIYGEENPHFTVQRARAQVSTPNSRACIPNSRARFFSAAQVGVVRFARP